jgi:hypothetical protein
VDEHGARENRIEGVSSGQLGHSSFLKRDEAEIPMHATRWRHKTKLVEDSRS